MTEVQLLIGDRDLAATSAATFGRHKGKAAINEFTKLRWITIQTTPRHYPF